MKLDSKKSIFNMGDTSIRVKQIVEVNKVVLAELDEFMLSGITWLKNPQAQENFYKLFLQSIVRIENNDGIELFSDFKRLKNYESPKQSRFGLRGRTLTNSLVKSGLIDSSRRISEVGKKYLQNTLQKSDKTEELLSLSIDNLLYLRQYLKLRIYSSDSDKFFYNFRFAIKFLSKYKDVPINDFLIILESIRPEQSEAELYKIIDSYNDVERGILSFEKYYNENFASAFISKDEMNLVKAMFENNDFTDENFIKFFTNSKSSKTSLLYKEFVISIINFKDDPSYETLSTMIDISREPKIKKAFSSGRLPFNYNNKMDPNTFIQANKHNNLLSNDNFDIFLEFTLSKHKDLIREYSDMCRRYFQITGLISFDNSLANLNNRWIINPLLEILGNKFSLTGEEPYEYYEEHIESPWFTDLSTEEILQISSADFNKLLEILSAQFGENKIANISQNILIKREEEFRNFIYSTFPKTKVIKILENIATRNDNYIFSAVTDNATVPTIYEYMITIAWFYLSEDKDYYIHKSFGVSLDGNKLPLIHQGGGKGDIEITTSNYSLLLETTLMDLSTQRRGELEPVIRHSINFSIMNNNESTTIFVANVLDDNVLNIFRATQFIELNSTLTNGKSINGINIFAFTTLEVIQLLKNNISDNKILKVIKSNLDTKPKLIENNWRSKILNDINIY